MATGTVMNVEPITSEAISGTMLYRIRNVRILYCQGNWGTMSAATIPSGDRPSANVYATGMRTSSNDANGYVAKVELSTAGKLTAKYSVGSGYFADFASTNRLHGVIFVYIV